MTTPQARQDTFLSIPLLHLSKFAFHPCSVQTAAALHGSPVTEKAATYPLPYPEPQIPQHEGEESKGWPTDQPCQITKSAATPCKTVFSREWFFDISPLLATNHRTLPTPSNTNSLSVTLVTSAIRYAY